MMSFHIIPSHGLLYISVSLPLSRIVVELKDMQTIPSFTGFKPCSAAPRNTVPRKNTAQSRQQFVVRASVVAEPATLEVKTIDGSSAGTASLSLKVADPETAKGLVHRYLVMVRQNARRVSGGWAFWGMLLAFIMLLFPTMQGTASTLTRSEVSGGGRKPYNQKGTGNARLGSTRTPLRPGGGVVFGPKPRDWTIDMNKKERRLAMATALQSAAADMIVVEDFAESWDEIKTSTLVKKLASVGSNPMETKTLLITAEPSNQLLLSGRNVERLAINYADSVQVYDVLHADKIIVEKSALQHIQEFFGPKDCMRSH